MGLCHSQEPLPAAGHEGDSELFLTSGSIQPYSQTFSSWRETYIVLHQIIFDINDEKTLDVISFLIGHELGAVRLNHTAVWNEMLLTYISSIKWLRNPLERVHSIRAIGTVPRLRRPGSAAC